MRRIATIVATTVLLALATTGAALAGGGGHGGTPCKGFARGQTLVMRDSCFEGVGHLVDAGTTLRVENAGQLPHTVTAVDGSFDSGVIAAGETFEVVLDEPGAVPVYCTLHGTAEGDGMAGLVQVTQPVLAASQDRAGGATVWWVVVGIGVAALGVVIGRRTARAVTPREESAAVRGS